MSRALLQKDLKDGFLNALVEGLDQATTNAVLFYYDTSGISLRFQWTYANKAGTDLFAFYKSGDVAKNYIKYTPPFILLSAIIEEIVFYPIFIIL